MQKNFSIYPLEITGKISKLQTETEIQSALKNFRQNASSAPTPRLYDAYRWLKQQLNTGDEEKEKHFTHFIEIFLTILEARGASGSEIYSEVLRDSAEYKYLRGLFHTEPAEPSLIQIEIQEDEVIVDKEPERLSLRDILLKKQIPITDIDIKEWHRLVDEYFVPIEQEDLFVKSCSQVINNIYKRPDKEPYHIEVIVVYTFDRLLSYKTLSLKSKDFSMQILNLMTGRGDMWKTLHKEYLEIIRR